MPCTVIEVLRRFLPAFLKDKPPLHPAQWRAIWAIIHCRSAALGGHLYGCLKCARRAFAYHSCNHRACPQCGRAATAQWVTQQLDKRINAPYFMVTFTLPSELREIFFGPHAKEAFDLFFTATSKALSEKLTTSKSIGASGCRGFIGVLHTWGQQLQFHPHIHYIVAGAGLDAVGRLVKVKNANFLAPLEPLRRAFRHHLRRELEARDWQVDPAVWRTDWGINIQPFGSGENAIKYLGSYVKRTAIADSRIVSADGYEVTFRWKDRAQGNRIRLRTLTGTEFVRRYLRHVLPRGLRSIRYFGFCHPAAKRKRETIAFLSGRPLKIGACDGEPTPTGDPLGVPRCPCCQRLMKPMRILRPTHSRGPPQPQQKLQLA